MKADVLPTMSPAAFKAHGPVGLRLSLHDLKEIKDEEDDINDSLNANTRLSWSLNGHTHSFDCSTDGSSRSSETVQLKKRSQSAKRPSQNGHGSPQRSDSPLFTKSACNAPHKPAPPRSAPSQRQRKSSKGRILKSREGSATTGDGSDHRTASPSPQRSTSRIDAPANGGLRASSRQSRRRQVSQSEDFSGSNGDLLSPRSVSDRQQQQQSLNGTLSSDTSESSLQGPNSCSSPSPTSSSGRAWNFFEEHVRTIHDASEMFTRHQGPSFQASCTFQETMVDLFGYPEYAHPPPTQGLHSVARSGLYVAGAASKFLKLRKRTTLINGFQKPVERPPADRKTVENAKRGWRILRQYVQENYCSKRTSRAALSWSMLRQTLKGMSNRDKTRVDLYRRYGIIPSVDDEGHLVMVNSMLSERARKAIANGSRHPLLVHNNNNNNNSIIIKVQPQLQPQDRVLSLSSSLPAALSSPLTSPRSSGDVPRQRRARSSVARVARADVRPTSTMSGSASVGGLLSSRNGAPPRKSSDLSSKSSSRSHTPSLSRNNLP